MNYTYFFHVTSPFSNFHPSKFEYKGLTFISNEQFMMFSKAKTFKDEDTANKIIAMNNHPLAQKLIAGELSRADIVNDKTMIEQWNKLMMSIKQLGREVKNYDDKVWTEKRFKIVRFGAKEKFIQNEDLKTILLNTGHSKMIECAPRDLIWGIGLSESVAKKTPPEQWPGLNLLGLALDDVKNYIVSLSLKQQIEISVVNFYHVGKSIPEDGVYIGRTNKNFGLNQSLFANPFPMKDNSEEERNRVVQEYQAWLWQQISENKITKNDLLNLNHKKLVCYCAPKKCHGDILKEIITLLITNENEFNNLVNQKQNKPSLK